MLLSFESLLSSTTEHSANKDSQLFKGRNDCEDVYISFESLLDTTIRGNACKRVQSFAFHSQQYTAEAEALCTYLTAPLGAVPAKMASSPRAKMTMKMMKPCGVAGGSQKAITMATKPSTALAPTCHATTLLNWCQQQLSLNKNKKQILTLLCVLYRRDLS